MRSHLRAAARAGLGGQTHKTASHEVRELVLTIDRRQTRDAPATPRHNDVDPLLDAIEVLTQAIVQGTNANLLLATM